MVTKNYDYKDALEQDVEYYLAENKRMLTHDSLIEITRFINNGVTHVLIAENNPGNVIYTYYVYNAKNTSSPLEVKFDLYNKLSELFTIKGFKMANYIIINGVKWENIENIKLSTVGETMPVIDDALSHGFSFLVHNHKLYYKED